jgi:hypothetical protein
VPLSHLLWRLSEGKTTPLSVAVTGRCAWPFCPMGAVEMVLQFASAMETKPEEARCPLCRKPLRVLSAKPLPGEPKAGEGVAGMPRNH